MVVNDSLDGAMMAAAPFEGVNFKSQKSSIGETIYFLSSRG
jgi:hypothetical protein